MESNGNDRMEGSESTESNDSNAPQSSRSQLASRTEEVMEARPEATTTIDNLRVHCDHPFLESRSAQEALAVLAELERSLATILQQALSSAFVHGSSTEMVTLKRYRDEVIIEYTADDPFTAVEKEFTGNFYPNVLKIAVTNGASLYHFLDLFEICLSQMLEQFSNFLVSRIASSPPETSLWVLIRFYHEIFNLGILRRHLGRYGHLCFTYNDRGHLLSVDRRKRFSQDTDRRPPRPQGFTRFRQVACHLFTTLILDKPLVRSLIQTSLANYLATVRDRMEQLLMRKFCGQNDATNGKPLSTAEIIHTLFEKNDHVEEAKLANNLLTILLNLDTTKARSIFHDVFGEDFLIASHRHALSLATKVMSVLAVQQYVRYVTKYLDINDHMVRRHLRLPRRTNQVYLAALANAMIVNLRKAIIDLIEHKHYALSRDLVTKLETVHNTFILPSQSIEKPITPFTIELFDELLLARIQPRSTKQAPLDSRSSFVHFVTTILSICAMPDEWCQEVFEDAVWVPGRTVHLIAKQMQSNQAKSALAYYFYATWNQMVVKPNGQMRSDQELDDCLAPLFFLMTMMQDHNDFYEYLKHYFALSVVHSQENDLDVVARRLALVEKCTHEMRSLNEIEQMDSLPSYAAFTHGSQVFHMITNNWVDSDSFLTKNRLLIDKEIEELTGKDDDEDNASSPIQLDNCRVLHFGLWKSLDYDQCKLPIDVHLSWIAMGMMNKVKEPNKKFLLNTKYCQATVALDLDENSTSASGHQVQVQLATTMHQISVLSLFESCDSLTYEQIVSEAKFQQEANVQQTLLSLVLVGLLKAAFIANQNAPGSTIHFVLNKSFQKESIQRLEPSIDMIHNIQEEFVLMQLAQIDLSVAPLEYFDFWSLAKTSYLQEEISSDSMEPPCYSLEVHYHLVPSKRNERAVEVALDQSKTFPFAIEHRALTTIELMLQTFNIQSKDIFLDTVNDCIQNQDKHLQQAVSGDMLEKFVDQDVQHNGGQLLATLWPQYKPNNGPRFHATPQQPSPPSFPDSQSHTNQTPPAAEVQSSLSTTSNAPETPPEPSMPLSSGRPASSRLSLKRLRARFLKSVKSFRSGLVSPSPSPSQGEQQQDSSLSVDQSNSSNRFQSAHSGSPMITETRAQQASDASSLNIRLECAIVRLMKRDKVASSMANIHSNLLQFIGQQPKGWQGFPVDQITLTMVELAVGRLMDKSYLEFKENGYHYIV